MARYRRLYLGRPAGYEDYELSTHKSDWCNDKYGFEEPFAEFCAYDFERVTGFHLEPGEMVKVRISVEVVE